MATVDKYTKGQDQLHRSKGNIEAKKRETYEEITRIKLRNEKHEKDRRDKEELDRHKRYSDLQNEAIESSKKNFALELKWAELKNIEECETLFKEILKQKEAFQEILNSKNKLIKRFEEDLEKKDEDYVKMLNQQKKDINDILEKMREQFNLLRKVYLLELNDIETEFLRDRTLMLNDHEFKLKELFESHSKTEMQIANSRKANEEKNAREIELIRINFQKAYADKKIRSENDIQNLEMCLEDMRALYLLNSEKLDYNFKVLKEKDDENTQLTGILKNKKRHHTRRLKIAMDDYAAIDAKSKQENKQLTEEYKRISRQFKELQNKFKHFEKADTERYNEIQKMNEAEVQELKSKIIKADKTIHIQQLGMQWNLVEVTAGASELNEMSKMQNSGSGSKNPAETTDDFIFDIPPLEMEIITDILLKETKFLLDEKTKATLEEEPDAAKRKAVQLETLKKVLALDSVEEMNMLYSEIYSRVRRSKNVNIFNEEEEGEEEGEEEEYNEAEEGDIEYDADGVVESLINFMMTQDDRKKELEAKLAKKSMIKETEREKKERIAKQGKRYWENITHVLPEHTFRIWKILDKSLSKYYTLLLERQKLIDETGDLHNQNEELKNLLNQYFQINHELIIPPTKMIQLEASQNAQ